MSSPSDYENRRGIVVDNIHGDIFLSELEWRVVNTASYQRLRSLKQLGMGHFVYPNATHTRFAHSIGVLGIMKRIVAKLRDDAKRVTKKMEERWENLQLAALLHDVGHYPYSHLMERVDHVRLTDEEIRANEDKTLSVVKPLYPDHEELGQHILQQQDDLKNAIGSPGRAREIGELFSRTNATDQQLSKLIHSSLDMDRLDYLLRDSRAAGVPYGNIDIDYLLNNIRISPKGAIGVELKALPAAEHFLLARLYMHRVVYYHKTTFGLEEACRQLLRRVRDKGLFKILTDGDAVKSLCGSRELNTFTDDYVDRIIREAALHDGDIVIATLARCITNRTPPKLLAEVSELEAKNGGVPLGALFRERCKGRLKDLAAKYDLPVGLFLLCGPKPVKIEERGALLTRAEHAKLKPEEREELIKIFVPGHVEPKSIVDVDGGVVKHLSGHQFGIHRLYLADLSPDASKRLPEIKKVVQEWACR